MSDSSRLTLVFALALVLPGIGCDEDEGGGPDVVAPTGDLVAELDGYAADGCACLAELGVPDDCRSSVEFFLPVNSCQIEVLTRFESATDARACVAEVVSRMRGCFSACTSDLALARCLAESDSLEACPAWPADVAQVFEAECGTNDDVCGNGKYEYGEVSFEDCDDGNDVSGDGCSSDCRVEHGYTCTAEQGVLSACTLTRCGDGVTNARVDAVESCDDGNTASGDGCSATCAREPAFACSSKYDTPVVCVQLTCGNGLVERDSETGLGEACDDGNTTDADGCNATCTVVDPSFVCSCHVGDRYACPQVPKTICRASHCGDGAPEANEACDDGNAASDDGCSATCQVEPTWVCIRGSGGGSDCRGADCQQPGPGAHMQRCNLLEVDLSGLDLTGADLHGAYAHRVVLTNANLTNADLRDANLTVTSAAGVTLTGARLAGALFNNGNLANAIAPNVDFRSASTPSVNFRGAQMPGAKLGGNLVTCTFDAADLTGASFVGSSPTTATFVGATLVGVDFTSAVLTSANFLGADLRNANFTNANLTSAVTSSGRTSGATWSNTTCPDGMVRSTACF